MLTFKICRALGLSALAVCCGLLAKPAFAVGEQGVGPGAPYAAPQAAPQAAPSLDPAAISAARELFRVTKFSRDVDKGVRDIYAELVKLAPAAHAGTVRDLEKQIVDQVSPRKKELVGRLVSLYARSFTIEELNAAIAQAQLPQAARVESPAFARYTQKREKLIARQSQIAEKWGQQLAKDMGQALDAELQRRGIQL